MKEVLSEPRASLPLLPVSSGQGSSLPLQDIRGADTRGGGRPGVAGASSSTVSTPPRQLSARGDGGRMSPEGGSVRGASFSSETGSVVVHEEGSYIR